MTDYIQNSDVYPLQNSTTRGWGVADQGKNPATKGANGQMTNQKGQTIAFWIESIESNFSMTGSKAQSRNVRQFFPHNVVQPSIVVKCRAPNQAEYNRMSSFVRSSQYNAINLGERLREAVTPTGARIKVETVRLLIRNGEAPKVWNGVADQEPGEEGAQGKHVKGIHVPWLVEGYVKSMKAGGERFNFAPEFSFEFFVAQSAFSKGTSNVGMWEDTKVYGSELKPWLEWIKKAGDFVTVENSNASVVVKEKKHQEDNLPAGGGQFDSPSIPEFAAIAAAAVRKSKK